MEMLWAVGDKKKTIGKNIYFFCICKCGISKWVRKNTIGICSFGCKSCSSGKATHKASGTRLYNIWMAMRQRCSNRKTIGYHTYGGSGVSVCSEWNKSFEAFRFWSESNGYKDDLSIDRINSEGNYEPLNCRWSTPRQQSRNTRRNIFFEHDGKRMILKDWCDYLGLNYGTVRDRIRRGHTIKQSLFWRKK